MSLITAVMSALPHKHTECELKYIRRNMTYAELVELSIELDQRKFDQLRHGLLKLELEDIESIEPAKVTWHGIDFYTIQTASEERDLRKIIMGLE